MFDISGRNIATKISFIRHGLIKSALSQEHGIVELKLDYIGIHKDRVQRGLLGHGL